MISFSASRFQTLIAIRRKLRVLAGVGFAALVAAAPSLAQAEALLLIEADSGRVLHAEQPTQPWYPASLTKVMTAYVALKAVKEGRLTLDSLLTVSPHAAAEQPSKMGFAAGTRLTLDNALKMMMVKSANDMAVVIAEGVSGSVDAFAVEMNRAAQRLGMTQTNYVNPNGLPDDNQVTSARDQAMLARAVYSELPEYEYYMRIQAIKHGRRVTQNFNRLMGRYPGADGMKTGFICASGYNLIGSATRDGKRLIAVVLGASSGQMRAVRAAQLLDRGFGVGTPNWMRQTFGTVDKLAPIDAMPVNLRDEMCGPRRKRPASDADEDSFVESNPNPALAILTAGFNPPTLRPVDMIAAAPAPFEPVIVYTGPKRSAAEAIAANEAEAAAQAAAVAARQEARRAKAKAAAAARAASKKNDAKKQDAKQAGTKPESAKPSAAKKPDASPKTTGAAKPAAKPASANTTKPAAPAKPAAAKPPAHAKPAAPAKPAATSKPAAPAKSSAGTAAKPAG